MNLIAKHAKLFKQFLTEQSSKIYSYLKSYCTHQNKNVRYVAFLALDSFFTEVETSVFSYLLTRWLMRLLAEIVILRVTGRPLECVLI